MGIRRNPDMGAVAATEVLVTATKTEVDVVVAKELTVMTAVSLTEMIRTESQVFTVSSRLIRL